MIRCTIIFLIVTPLIVSAKAIEVCKTCPIQTIKQGIQMAKAGDEITIRKGLYKERVIYVDKSITLIGQQGAVIDAEKSNGVFILRADSIALKGLTIINIGASYTVEYAAIKMTGANYFLVENCILKNAFFGILVEKSDYGTLRGNTISSNNENEANSGNGIHIWHSSNITIENNEIFGMRDGIYFEFVTHSKIYNNLSHNNIRYGLHFMFSNNDEYYHNQFSNNGAGVAVMFSKFIGMRHNTFQLNWGSSSYGLLLKEMYDADIENNIFKNNTIGINVEGSTRINYGHNVFESNGWAIKVLGACYQNIFTNNDFIYNSFDLSYNSQLNDNNFEGNYWSSYNGYDLDEDGIGDVPFRPVKLFSYIVNKLPEAIILLRSLFIDMLNFSEKISPVFTPDDLLDRRPLMKKIND